MMYRRSSRAAILTVATALVGCASQPVAQPAEGIFVGETVQEVTGKLASLCMSNGYEIVDSTSAFVLCQRNATATEDMIYRGLLVGSGGTPAVKKIRFSMAALPEGVRVMGTLSIESTQVFGQVKTMPMKDAKTAGEIRSALVSAGAL